MSKISVIIPVYNVEKYLRECLDSVVNQTLKDIEIICVDDGSTDSSLSILQEYAQKDDRFIVLEQKNKGAGAARNRGLKIAKGEYLYFLDSDDYVANTMFEKMYNKIQCTDSEICVCLNNIFDQETNELRSCNWINSTLIIKDYESFSRKEIPEKLFQFCNIPAFTKLYLTKFIKNNKVKFQEIRSCNDVFFNFYTIACANKITLIKEELVTHRQSINSITKTRGQYIDCILMAFQKLKKALNKKEIYKELQLTLYSMAKVCFNYELEQLKTPSQRAFWKPKLDDFLHNIYPNEKTPKVSIIIPVYNVEKYIKECLQSITRQTLEDIEIICVNDGSTDNSLDIIREYEQIDNRIKVINKINEGAAVARNKGLNIARGEFVAFMDPDDFYPGLNILEKLYNLAKQNEVLICGGGMQQMKPDGSYMTENEMVPQYTFKNNEIVEYINYQFDYGYTRFIYDRQFLYDNNINFPNYLRQEDPPFFIKAMSTAKKFYAVSEPTYTYRVSYKTVVWDEIKTLDTFRGIEDCLKQCEQNGFDILYCNIFKRVNTGNWFSKAVTDVIWSEKVRQQVIKTFSNINQNILLEHGIDSNLHEIYKSIIEHPVFIPTVSVIVPVYNVEKYLRKCLDSIINQTLKNIEIICVNDGSTDNSKKILEKYASKDGRIKIINKRNGGLSSARNAGLKHATGEYVGFVDSDDWIEPETYEVAYSAIKKRDVEIVNWGANIVAEDGDYTSRMVTDAEQYHKIKLTGLYDWSCELYNKTTVTVWNKLFKLSLIKDKKIYFPEGLLHEDNEFIAKYLLYCKKIYYLDRYYYNYLQRKDSIMGKEISEKNPRKKIVLAKIYKNIYFYYKRNNTLYEHRQLLSLILDKTLWHLLVLAEDKSSSLIAIKKLAKIIDNNILNNHNLFLILNNRINEISYAKDIKFPEQIRFNPDNDKYIPFAQKIFSSKNIGIHKVICILGIKIKLKSKKLIRRQQGVPEMKYSFAERIFSIKNSDVRKFITILGVKFKFKCQKLVQREQIRNLEHRLNDAEKELKSLREKINA